MTSVPDSVTQVWCFAYNVPCAESDGHQDPSQSSYSAANQTITYTYTLQNSGNVTLASPFTVTDSTLGSISCVGASLAVVRRPPAPRQLHDDQADLDATRRSPTRPPATPSSAARRSTPHRHRQCDAGPGGRHHGHQDPSQSSYSAANQTITYTYTLQNSGNVTLASRSRSPTSRSARSPASAPAWPWVRRPPAPPPATRRPSGSRRQQDDHQHGHRHAVFGGATINSTPSPSM